MKKSELKQIIKEELKKISEAKYKFTKHKWEIKGNYLVVSLNDTEEAQKIVQWIKSLGDDAKEIAGNKVLINMQDVCTYYLNNHL